MNEQDKETMQQRLAFLVNSLGGLALEGLKGAAPGKGYGFVVMLVPPATGEYMPCPMTTNIEPDNLYATLRMMADRLEQERAADRMRIVRNGVPN